MEDRIDLKIAKYIGQPLDENHDVPVELQAVADIDTADPGEKVYSLAEVDDDVDTIIKLKTNGEIEAVEAVPEGDTELSFSHFNSLKRYVRVDKVLDSLDIDILGRKKEGITRGMDKREVYILIQAILGTDGTVDGITYDNADDASGFVEKVSYESGDDLYDMILKAKHKVEDYGDNFVLFMGPTIKEKLDDYSKRKSEDYNYDVNLNAKLKEWNIKPVKVFGKVKLTKDGSAERLMDSSKFILFALNSRVGKGKPVTFVRRKINEKIAKLMGCDVDNAQRALIVGRTPENIDGSDTLAYSIFGYQSYVMAIKNTKAIVKADCSNIWA